MYPSFRAVLFAVGLTVWAGVSQAAEPPWKILFDVNEEESIQCGKLLESAEGAPVDFRMDPFASLLDRMTDGGFKRVGPALRISPPGPLVDGAPALSEIGRSFVFRDLAHFRAFSRSALFEEEAGKARGVRPIALAYRGTAYVMSRKPIREPKEMGGLKIEDKYDRDQGWASAKARAGGPLKSGQIDAAVLTPIEAVRDGLSDAAPFFNLVAISLRAFVFTVNEPGWQGLNPSQRGALSAWAKRMADQCSARIFEAEKRAIETLKKQGVQIIEPHWQAFESQRPDPTGGMKSEEGKAFIRRIQAIR
ncbi:MAG: TRAP transporter substrate-binding protein DctP [Candidatus Tectomicrobia bacterium]|uniref:TRAP transporter substrate-binding protein DctP n=1 Tax=Tectimicrobiota bacterium TaxID=2528274 RepID=A0A932HZK6_UNCTE|nr:TRAP transporter substrate-binding protein DctP [Candidatus Tectomicrobia bacterium]